MPPAFIGRSVRHYRVEAELGTGGTGVVYRATDTHLSRPVALKILTAGSIPNPERRRRFLQEARAASLLNHPNIIAIYDTGTEEVDGSRVDFIAMELVEGRTLEAMISGRALPLRDALELASQIAGALSVAHAAGIVHRDLKPSNVMVNERGTAKVLDFGLAKMVEPAAAGVDDFAVTEPVSLHTEEGVIMGTVAYMSPEQAEGKKLDSRSDIFSFGSLLYEMISGRKAFAGDSKVSVLSAVLLKEPAPLDAPPALVALLRRCLKKDPAKRWQSMADLRVALEEIREELNSPSAPAAGAPALAAAPSRRWMLAGLGGLALGAAPAAWLARRYFKAEPPSYQRLTFRRGDVLCARFAPGGSVVYAAETDGAPVALYTVQPGSRESRPLGISHALLASMSSSGEMAILTGVRENGTPGTLARVPYSGGTPREVLEGVVAADWGPDGETMAVSRVMSGGRQRIEYPIGASLDESESRPYPSVRVSASGRQVAYFAYDPEVGDYAVAVAGAGVPKRLLSRGWRATAGMSWSPGGDEVWFSAVRSGAEPAFYAVSLTGKERLLTGTTGYALLLDVDREGRLLLTNTDSRIGIRALQPGAGAETELAWLESSFLYGMSDDGGQVLFVELSHLEGRNTAIYLRKTDGSPAVKLGYGNRPALSPDRKSVLCIRRDQSSSRLTILPTGAGEARTLPGEGLRYESGEWFPDGKRVLFAANERGRPVRSFVQDVEGGAARAVTPEGLRASRVSPDGRSLLLVQNRKLCVRAVEGGESRPITDMDATDTVLRWSGDGGRILIRRDVPATRMVQLVEVDAASGRGRVLRELRPPEPGANFMGAMACSADGRSYAYSYQRDLAVLYLLRGIK